MVTTVGQVMDRIVQATGNRLDPWTLDEIATALVSARVAWRNEVRREDLRVVRAPRDAVLTTYAANLSEAIATEIESRMEEGS